MRHFKRGGGQKRILGHERSRNNDSKTRKETKDPLLDIKSVIRQASSRHLYCDSASQTTQIAPQLPASPFKFPRNVTSTAPYLLWISIQLWKGPGGIDSRGCAYKDFVHLGLCNDGHNGGECQDKSNNRPRHGLARHGHQEEEKHWNKQHGYRQCYGNYLCEDGEAALGIVVHPWICSLAEFPLWLQKVLSLQSVCANLLTRTFGS